MAADQPEIRRTKAVVVKALCDILRPVIDGLVVLELFAGSARVSQRLLEEGAEEAYAVDLEPRSEGPEPEILTWYKEDVFTFLESGPPKMVDLVFMDPPYESGYIGQLLPQLAAAEWLSEQGIVVAENSTKETDLPAEVSGEARGSLYLMRNRNYGGTRLSIYQANREEPGIETDN